MNFIEQYLQKNSFQSSIETLPLPDLNIIVVIPSFNEPDIIPSLESLYQCDRPNCALEVIIVINAPENSDEKIIQQNNLTNQSIIEWLNKHHDPRLSFHVILRNNLPKKHAGVGLARKTGMDEAIFRFHSINNPNGIITGFDADSLCDQNYFVAIEHHFQKHAKSKGASIYFEHPINDIYIDNSKLINGITQYELHLRYLNQAIRYTGHPHAFHTVGSSFAVRADEYVRQGGMNKRQAGEDFYFLQKIIATGNFTEINNTRVIPSPRISDRVPFGTGASMKKWMESDNSSLKTYNLNTFRNLKQFFSAIDLQYKNNDDEIKRMVGKLDVTLIQFLNENDYLAEIISIKKNTSNLHTFRKRFFRWFNAFMVIKYLNYSQNNGVISVDISDAAKELLRELGISINVNSAEELLIFYRDLERIQNNRAN